MKDHQTLLYMLERVRAACPTKHQKFYCSKSDTEQWSLLVQLEEDGLVRRYSEDEDSTLWEPA